MRYFIRLSYSGAGFHGWQVQPGEESIQAFADFCTLLDDQVPYIILGDFGTVCWYSENMIPDRQGVDMYWWNSYFKAA